MYVREKGSCLFLDTRRRATRGARRRRKEKKGEKERLLAAKVNDIMGT